MPRYELIDRAYPFRLRGDDNQQNDTGLLYVAPTYRVPGASGITQVAPVVTPIQGFALPYFSLHNRSGGSIAMGIGVRIPNRYWIAGQWVNADTTAFTDDTVDAQDAGGADVALETTTGSDGFVVASTVLFNALSIDVGTASAGGSPVRVARYSNSAGSGWIDFANLYLQDGATGQLSTGENLVIWAPPTDWGRIQAGGLSGIPQGLFAVNVRATTAPSTTAAVADNLSLYRLYRLTEGIADNGILDYEGATELLLDPAGEALVAFFGTANNQNRVSCLVRTA